MATTQSNPRLSELIRDHRDEIITTWQRAVRDLPDAHTRPVLGEHVSELLDRLAYSADAHACGAVAQLPRAVAELHAVDRVANTGDLPRAILELGVLGECVSRVCKVDPTSASLRDPIAEAIASTTGVDPLLRRVLKIVHDAVPAIDTAAVLLRDGDRLVTRAAIGLDESFAQAVGEGFAGGIAAAGKPRAIADGDPQLAHPALRIGGLRIHSAFGVPLADADGVFGVAHVGSLTSDELSAGDREAIAAMFARLAPSVRQRMCQDVDSHAERELVMLRTVADHGPQLAWIANGSGAAVWVNERWREHTGTGCRELASAFHADHARRLLDALAGDEPFHDDSASARRRWRSIAGSTPARCRCASTTASSAGSSPTRTSPSSATSTRRRSCCRRRRPATRETLERIAHLLVPSLADRLHRRSRRRRRLLSRAAIAHADPERLPALEAWARAHPALPDAALRSGEPELSFDDAGDHDVARAYITTPLVARGRSLGAITLASASRRYTRADVAIARELGRRVGIAVDNARIEQDERQGVQQREDLLSIVSQEMRAPLSAIDLGASMLIQHHGKEPRTRKQLDVIRRSAERMDRLLGDLGDMVAIQSGRLVLDRKVDRRRGARRRGPRRR